MGVTIGRLTPTRVHLGVETDEGIKGLVRKVMERDGQELARASQEMKGGRECGTERGSNKGCKTAQEREGIIMSGGAAEGSFVQVFLGKTPEPHLQELRAPDWPQGLAFRPPQEDPPRAIGARCNRGELRAGFPGNPPRVVPQPSKGVDTWATEENNGGR